MKRILLTLAFGAALMAQGYGDRPGYNRPVLGGPTANYAERIARGERMGLLTHREAARLWAMERDLREETARAARSGFGMSHWERERLAEMSLRLDRAITAELRDGDRAYRGRW